MGKGRGKYHTPSQAAKLFGNNTALTSRESGLSNGASSNGGGGGNAVSGDSWGMVAPAANNGGGGFGNGGGFGGSGFGGGSGGFGGSGFGDSGGNTDRFADPGKETEITIQVYNGNLPRIIGKGGSSIQQISADSSARVDIDKDGGDGDTTPIKISGSQLNVDHAKKLIDEICQKFKGIVGDSNGGGGGGGGFGGGGGGFGGEETTIDIWIPEDKCGRVIGRGGSKIGEIQDDTGANVKVHGRETAEDGKVMITLSGASGSCEKAQKIIEELTAERGGGGGGGGYNPTGPQVMLDMWVETGRLGRLIGKGGSMIREVGDKFNIRIDISKDNIKDQDTGVVLTGSDEDTKNAKTHIDELTERDQMDTTDFGAAADDGGGW